MLLCIKHLPEELAHLVSALNKYYIVVSVITTITGNLPCIRLQITYHEICKFEPKTFTQNLICKFGRLLSL